MDLIPTISTPREQTARQTSRKWEGTYEEYLQSPHWRKTRDRALSRAGWKCNRCPTQRALQVHHKTYERLGCELPEDLEVLCATCHEGHHIDEQNQVRGIYARVVSAALGEEHFTCMADLLEAVKVKCARNKIPYDGPKIWRAIKLVDANRAGVLDAPKAYCPPTPGVLDQRPITEWEAKRMLGDLGAKVVRSMPKVTLMSRHKADSLRALKLVMQAIADQAHKCDELENSVNG